MDRKNLSKRKFLAYAGIFLGAVILASVVSNFFLTSVILDGYVKGKVERAFTAAHPGYTLRITKLSYSMWDNRIAARSVEIETKDLTFIVGPVTLAGVRRERLLSGKIVPADLFSKSTLDAANLDIKLVREQYSLRFARLRASVPDSALTAEGVELSPLKNDDEVLAASPYRMTRFNVIVPSCTVSGIAYNELLDGKSYHARTVQISSPTFDALVSRDKPIAPFVKSPLMLNEALASITRPLDVGSIIINNGLLKYSERIAAGTPPGVLTVTAVNCSAENIVNRGNASTLMLVHVQGLLYNAGVLDLLMSVPVMLPKLSLTYSGTLGEMGLMRLNAFLEIAERIRIKSGTVQEVKFNVNVSSGRASGRVRAAYKDFTMAFMDKTENNEYGIGNQFATFMANAFKFRGTNTPNTSVAMKVGEIKYTRKPDNEFAQFLWYAVRSGILDILVR